MSVCICVCVNQIVNNIRTYMYIWMDFAHLPAVCIPTTHTHVHQVAIELHSTTAVGMYVCMYVKIM